ncbi:cobalt-precorrin-6x reductase [Blastochloris viridis]|nr:cobalt-precorrin-6x reductase [Blastochloris viridis]
MDNHGPGVPSLALMTQPLRLLILGGSTEATRLAAALAQDAAYAATVSFAGRTEAIVPPPVPYRVGGFGGIDGLVQYLMSERIDGLIDATHPFAAQMKAHAVTAAKLAGVPLLGLERPAWTAGPGDRWTEVDRMDAAVDALGDKRRRVFLGIGRLNLHLFARAPQHAYLVRLVDPPREALPLPDVEVVVARGPFHDAADRAMLERFGAEMVVTKNSGGTAADAKLVAARALGLPVVMVRRPAVPERQVVATVADALGWLSRLASETPA